MSASDNLHGIQFEHHKNAVKAYDNDKRVGELVWREHEGAPLGSWTSNPGYRPQPGEIWGVDVHPDYQRRGIASEMLHRAAQVEPRLHHGQGVSDEGRAFIAKHPQFGPGRVAPKLPE